MRLANHTTSSLFVVEGRKENYNLAPVLASNMTTVTNITPVSSSTFDPGRADDYFDHNQLDECEQYLKEYYHANHDDHNIKEREKKKNNDPEILWRYARLLHRQTESVKPNDTITREQLIRRSLAFIEEALEVLETEVSPQATDDATKKANNGNDSQYYSSYASCYKWKALLIGELGNYVTIKEKISNAFVIKELFLKSLDMQQKISNDDNGNDGGEDPVVLFGMGEWCSRVAATGYLQRTLASTLFAVPPESSYDEACLWYRKALKEKPDFKRCYYCLGETLWAMGQKEQAKTEGYRKCLEIPSSRPFEYELDTLAKKRL